MAHRTMDRACCAIVLAAGQGTRFGGKKLLAPWRGAPVLSHVLRTLGQARTAGWIARIVVVIPADAAELTALTRLHGGEAIPQPDAMADQRSSLRLGLSAAAGAGAALITLGDQPLLRADAIASVLAAGARHPDAIVSPAYADAPNQPGHPVLVPARWWYLADSARGFRPAASDGVPTLQIAVPGVNPDIDTPADLRALDTIDSKGS